MAHLSRGLTLQQSLAWPCCFVNGHTDLRLGVSHTRGGSLRITRSKVSAASSSAGGEAEDAGSDQERISLMLEPGIWSDPHTSTNWQVQLFETVEEDIDRLEDVLIKSQEESYGSNLYFNNLWESQSKADRLNLESYRMQTLLDSKENSLIVALHEETNLKNHLREAELRISSLNLCKEANEVRQAEELLKLERSSWSSLQILDKHLVAIQAMNNTQEMVQKVQESIVKIHHDSVAVKVIEILQKEATLSLQALLMTTQELEQEKTASGDLLSKWQNAVEEMKEKSLQIARLNQALADSKHVSKMVSEALAKAEGQVSARSQKLINAERSLEKEKKALSAAREGLEKLEQALGEEESKVDDLFKEVSSLKAQLEEKEEIVVDLSIKNKGLSEAARKNLDAFHHSEKRVEQLMEQCHVLENQIRCRDILLEEIKEETFKSTEALRLAAQIKQDLNNSRQREVELRQELEGQNSYVKELSEELNENSRAVRAELALRQAEKNVMDLTTELNILKKGIQSRDEVIKLMQEKIDGNIHILRKASENRETMRKMQVYINNLELKVKEFTVHHQKPESCAIEEVLADGKSFHEVQ